MAAPSYVAQGAAAAVTTTGAPGYPAGMSAGDTMVLDIFSDASGIQTPSGWTPRGSVTTAGGLSGRLFTKTATGSETGTLTVSVTSGTKGVAVITAYRPVTGGHVLVPTATYGSDTDTSSTAFTAAGSSWTTALDDRVVACYSALGASAGTFSAALASVALTQAGATLSTTARYNSRTATNTIAYGQIDGAVTAGGTGAPSLSGTAAGANAAGVIGFLNLHERSNTAPTANAGADQSGLAVGAVVTLNGTASSDPDGDALTYLWAPISGPAATLSSTNVASPTYTATSSGTYVWGLTVTDEYGATSSQDTVSITVTGGSSYIDHSGAVAATTSAAPSYPTTVLAGDLLIFYVASDSSAIPTTLSGWTALGAVITGGGLSDMAVWKVAVGGETGTVTLSGITGGTKGWADIIRARPSASGTVRVTTANGTGTDTDTSSTAFSAAASSWTVAAADLIITPWSILAAAAGSFSANASSPAIAQAGGTVTSTGQFAGRTGTNTIEYGVTTAVVSAGGTGAPSFTATGVGANAAGVARFIRLRESTNTAPAANAGADQAKNVGDLVTLNGTASSDTDGDTFTYAWSHVFGPYAGSLSSTTVASPTYTATGAGTDIWSLTVTDQWGAASSADTVSIVTTVAATVNAGPDQTGIEPWSSTPVTLAGTSSNGTYSWTQTAGTTVTLTGATTSGPTFPPPAGVMAGETLTFQLSNGAGQTDTVNIGILPATEFRRVAGAWVPERWQSRTSGAWV